MESHSENALAERLLAMGCETGQGYLFSRPMPAVDVPDWIAGHPPRGVTTG